jgi:predicted hydrocarbon binding protein
MLNQFFDKYIFTSTLKYTHNNFYLVNVPFVIAPVDIFLSLSGSSDSELHKKIYLAIKEDTKTNFLKRFDTLGIEQNKELEFVRAFFIASGWGSINVIDDKVESKRAILVIENSPFANELKGKATFPVDTFIRGVLAGLFCGLFKEDVDCVESECVALNATVCKFIIKPKTEFDLTSKIVQDQLPL